MRSVNNGIKKAPHPERDPERGEGEQSKDAKPAIQISRRSIVRTMKLGCSAT